VSWEVLAHGYGLAEAPTVEPGGTVLFSDVLGGGVHRWDASGDIATVVPKRRGVGGIALHADGGFVCSGRDLLHVRVGADARQVLHIDGVAGWNDLCTDAAGNVYAGALRFAVFDPDAEVVAGELWRVAHDGDAEPLLTDVVHANGVAWTPDGGTLYLSDTRRQRLIIYEPGARARRDVDVSALGHPDGMAVDEQGCVWLALVSGGIARLTPAGEVDERLDVPSTFTTSCCFDGRDLVVTTGNHAEHADLGGCVLRTTVAAGGATLAPARV
jgi:gluconolactonase